MTCDILIKSYPPDFEWLTYSLRSIEQFAKGFRRVIVMIPKGSNLALTKERIIYSDDHGDGYCYQMVCKLNADLHTDADFILHIDSDTILTREVCPEDFITNGKPNWMITPWGALEPKDKLAWYPVMTKCLLESPRYEFMRRNLMMIPRWAYGLFRDEIKRIHGIPMDAYVMNQQPARAFSEYNCLGFFLYLYHNEKINWIDTTRDNFTIFERQFWSWGGVNQLTKLEMERILT